MNLSNLSIDREASENSFPDQQLPLSPSRSRRRISPLPPSPSLPQPSRSQRPRLMDIVINENNLRSERDSCYDQLNFTRIAPGNLMDKLPPKKPEMQDLHQTVEKVYREGNRSPELTNLVRAIRGPLALRLVTTSADYVLRLWENDGSAAHSSNQRQGSFSAASQRTHNRNMVIQVMSATLLKVNPSVITLFSALYYIGRLRKMFPNAKGELGCGIRLFTVALLIAYRYHESPDTGAAFYHAWSTYSHGLFSARDLLRMEMEMVAFLGYSLYISFEDFEYFVDRVFNSELGQVVPRCLDLQELGRPIGLPPVDEDATVPTDISNVFINLPPHQ